LYSNERDEPAHVHVDRDSATAKFWLRPVSLASTRGFAPHELTKLQRLVREHLQELDDAWTSFVARLGRQGEGRPFQP
jgi:hypothetical protein